jgi:catechol 2,3-dioxygenase-like lactoylglutathione lyase family enzyme
VFSSIHSVTVIVADQDKALDFYTNVLGFNVAMDMPMGDYGRWLTVSPPGESTQLVLFREGDEGAVDARGKFSGITLTTPDIESTYTTLNGQNVKFEHPPAEMPWGQKATWFSDPDGNQFFLVEQ